jgi:hypothetical protein
MLEVDDSYLCTAIDLLCGFILGVILLAWDSVCPGNHTFVLYLACAYAATADAEQRWPLAESLHKLAARCTSSTPGSLVFTGAAQGQSTPTSPHGIRGAGRKVSPTVTSMTVLVRPRSRR